MEYQHATDHFRYKREQIEEHMARSRVPQLMDDSFSAAFRAMLGRMSHLSKKTTCQGLLGLGGYDIAAQVYWCRTFAQVKHPKDRTRGSSLQLSLPWKLRRYCCSAPCARVVRVAYEPAPV